MTFHDDASPGDSRDEAPRAPRDEARAALTLVESLIETLEERGLLADSEVDDIFEAAIAAHRAEDGPASRSVARILERLHVHGNAVRKPR